MIRGSICFGACVGKAIKIREWACIGTAIEVQLQAVIVMQSVQYWMDHVCFASTTDSLQEIKKRK